MPHVTAEKEPEAPSWADGTRAGRQDDRKSPESGDWSLDPFLPRSCYDTGQSGYFWGLSFLHFKVSFPSVSFLSVVNSSSLTSQFFVHFYLEILNFQDNLRWSFISANACLTHDGALCWVFSLKRFDSHFGFFPLEVLYGCYLPFETIFNCLRFPQ